MANDDRVLRRVLCIALIASLMLTTGCSGFLADSTGTGTATPTTEDSESGTTDQLTPANGTDLRSVAIPDNGSTTVSGELDAGDPTRENRVYEPVQFTAEAGTVVDIAMETDGGEPTVRLLNPNGTVVDVASDGGPATAQLTEVGLRETGRYTIEATSAEPNTTFAYTLTVERVGDELGAGPPSMWNETEQYLEFGLDLANTTNETANYGRFYETVGNRNVTTNATGDYVVVTYVMDPSLNRTQKIDVDVSILVSYRTMEQVYQDGRGNESTPVDEEWLPELVFFRAVTPDGELYRTNFVTTEWARDAQDAEKINSYAGSFYSTSRYGPAHPDYNSSDGELSTTEAEFPLGTYDDYLFADGTPFSERHG